MRPLILKFAENPKFVDLDYSLIEYSNKKNLSVIKGTDIAAISALNMNTETFTKSSGEPSDSDNNLRLNLKRLLDTSTETFTSTEPSDSDKNHASLKLLMDTNTGTRNFNPESPDSDR